MNKNPIWSNKFQIYILIENRVVAPGESKDVNGLKFENFGSHSNTYPIAYFSVASAIGIKKEEIDLFIKRLQKVLDAVKSNEA